MTHIKRLAPVLLAVVLGLLATVLPSSAAGPYTYFPTASTTDARMLNVSGSGLVTLAGQSTDIEFSVPAGTLTFEIGIFDGDNGKDNLGNLNPSGGHWDVGTSETYFQFDADPSGIGSGPLTSIATWNGNAANTSSGLWSTAQSGMPDNDWWNVTVQTSAAAQSYPGGPYFYHMHVSMADPNSTSANSFKLRTTGALYMVPGNSWGFLGAVAQINDLKTIYPQWNGVFPSAGSSFWLTATTTYDGNWTFNMPVPNGVTSVPIWDGDFDFGADPTQPNGYPSGVPIQQCAPAPDSTQPQYPPFPHPGALAYGSAGTNPGNPSDDAYADSFRRPPCVNYKVTDPNGHVYLQPYPSSNQEWKLLNLTPTPVPSGNWRIDVNGLDLSNLSFFHFPFPVCGVDANGNPACPPLGTIGDFVWNDINGNGIQDGTEPGVPGVTVNLLNSSNQVIATTTTDSTGHYLFSNLASGSYTVQFVAPGGDTFTTKNAAGSTPANDSNANSNGTTDAITLAAGQTDLTIDAGLLGNAALGDKVWNDINGDGIQQTNEPGISGVTVNLMDSTGTTVLSSTTTDANGIYHFTNLVPGTYQVQFVSPAGYAYTQYFVGSGANAGTDSNANPAAGGKSGPITLISGQTDNTWDAGLYQPSALSGYVYVDANNNGIKETGEAPISGVTVTLTGTDGLGNPVTLTTTTDSNGYYSFPNLVPGTYTITETQPAGYGQGINAIGSQGGTVGPTTDVLSNIVLGSGVNGVNNNFGERLGSIGDRVWLDTNGNGIQNTGELGVAGVKVNLLNGSGSPATDAFGHPVPQATTDANGNYLFTNLLAGNYIVQFTAPNGDVFTQQYAQGADGPSYSTNNTDSNVHVSGPDLGKTDVIPLTAGQTNPTVDAGLVLANCATGTGTWNFNSPIGNLGNSHAFTVNGLTITAYGFNNGNPGTGTPLYGKNDAGDEHGVGIASDGDHEIDINHFVQLDLNELITAKVTNAQMSIGSMQTGEPANVYGSNTQGVIGNLVGTIATTLDDKPITMPGFPTYRYISVRAATATPANVLLQMVSFSCAPPATASIGDFVWEDKNANGIQDGVATPLPVGVTVQLLGSNGNLLKTTTTDANGKYSFTGLAAGTYYVQFTAPTGYTFTQQYAKVNGQPAPTVDSNANPITGKTDLITLVAGQTDNTIDAGLYKGASIGDFVWNDLNGNGIQNSGEPGISGVKVTLLGSNGTTVIATTTTDANGKYLFSNLAVGTYYVQFTAPSGYTFTAKIAAGSTTANDSNADSSGKTGAITLAVGTTDITIDAGLVKVIACVSGTKWNFNSPIGNLGNSHAFTVNGLTITAYGFNNGNPGSPTALYGKNDAGDEHGIGIASDGDHEIDIKHFVQLDMSQLEAAGWTGAQMSIGSMQTGEPAKVFGSATLGSIGTYLGTIATTQDDKLFTMPGFPTYKYISVQAGTATPANVLLQMVSFTCTQPASPSGSQQGQH